MARTKSYGHYCAAARALEIVGEKWSLLVVRDLLFGPQRFSDLLRSLGGVTPKLLTARLRDLETADVIKRDEEPGRREVWYRLTPAGQELRPVLEALLVWGIDHAAPPRPGETINPRRAAATLAVNFNRRGVRPSRPLVLALREEHAIGYDGERWSYQPCAGAEPDLRIEADPGAWVDLLRASPLERARLVDALPTEGGPEVIAAFRTALSQMGSAADANTRS